MAAKITASFLIASSLTLGFWVMCRIIDAIKGGL